MAVLYVRLPDDLRDTLRARAEAEGRSMSNLAVWFIRQQLGVPYEDEETRQIESGNYGRIMAEKLP